jgi:hypothetical protein
MVRTRTYRRSFPTRLRQSRRHASCGTIGTEMQTIMYVGHSGGLPAERARTQIGKMKPLAMPCITPCVSIKCHSFVLKAIPSIVETQRMQPTPIIGLYLLGNHP